MKIYHSKEFVNVDLNKAKFILELQSLTDAELAHHFPKLAAKYDRDGIIKAVVFGVEK
jgi:hypothetical protein